jgi:hypothetical protein
VPLLEVVVSLVVWVVVSIPGEVVGKARGMSDLLDTMVDSDKKRIEIE